MKLASEKIARTPLEYSQLIEKLDTAIYICNADGVITFYNKAAALLWGREPELGKDLWCGSWKIYHLDGTPMQLGDCPMAQTLKYGKETTNEIIIVETPLGKQCYVNPHPKVIVDEGGTIIGAINMLIDVTGSKMTERKINEGKERYRKLSESQEQTITEKTDSLRGKNEELRNSEERLHKMIEEIQDYAIILLDKDGTILNWNKGAEKIKGYSEKEIVGKNFEVFYLPEDQQSGLPHRLIAQAKEEGRAQHEGWRRRKDGTNFWGSIVITALHDEDKNVIGFTKVTRDLTERKFAEDKIKKYTLELELQNRELEEFAFAASHDLQEPLRKIQTFSALAKEKVREPEVAEKYLDKINSSASRMSSLIKDVLAYSMVTKDKTDFTSINLDEILKSVREDLETLLEERNCVITSTDLPVIQGIPVQLHQLFYNIINNSIKFSGSNPRIEITCERAKPKEILTIPRLTSGTKYIKLTFKDNGRGFEQQFADQIFKLFQRLNDTQPGNGIGLTLCKKIVENHHGYIIATSIINQGATFTVFLPA